MSDNKIMVIGEKETFLVRVILKKLRDAGNECVFIDWNVDNINKAWSGTALVTVYMEEDRNPPMNELHFLVDRMGEDNVQMIPIGEKQEISYIQSNVPSDMIYKAFIRPMDNEEFVATVNEIFDKRRMGAFKKSILIVDDDASYLGLVREWLKDTYKVSMANSGMQAIKWLGKNKADLILLDHEMPVTSGPQVLEMLRNDEETKKIPVMFLTGKSDKESVMQVVALKPEGYFLKTIGREELLKNLREYFMMHP